MRFRTCLVVGWFTDRVDGWLVSPALLVLFAMSVSKPSRTRSAVDELLPFSYGSLVVQVYGIATSILPRSGKSQSVTAHVSCFRPSQVQIQIWLHQDDFGDRMKPDLSMLPAMHETA